MKVGKRGTWRHCLPFVTSRSISLKSYVHSRLFSSLCSRAFEEKSAIFAFMFTGPLFHFDEMSFQVAVLYCWQNQTRTVYFSKFRTTTVTATITSHNSVFPLCIYLARWYTAAKIKYWLSLFRLIQPLVFPDGFHSHSSSGIYFLADLHKAVKTACVGPAT